MAFLVAMFIILFFTDRSRFFNVYWLGFILIAFVLYFLNETFFKIEEDNELYYLSISVLIFAFIPFMLLLLSIITFFNSKILMEKEGRRIRNLFISGIGIASLLVLCISVYQYLNTNKSITSEFLYFYVVALFVYFLWLFTSCALYTWIYVITPIAYKPDYIIILGSGLIGDRVPPLLASRLDKAVKQYKKYNEKPLLITSGGQGSDELVSEACAMKKYIIEKHHIEPNKIIAEDRSTTTFENLLFSKAIIDERVPNAHGVFVTNNFHVYRASMHAAKVQLKAVGIGSKTALYYIPNAFMREYIGILEMTKWRQLFILALFTIGWYFIMKGYI
ncbi:ElyC/SanA/YdcF family protein [Solibacillus silvestris]|uniref:YdcF family protein n=1 Tax=Solibacillus silvestris TaxID=76853 RepID=UPI003F81981B